MRRRKNPREHRNRRFRALRRRRRMKRPVPGKPPRPFRKIGRAYPADSRQSFRRIKRLFPAKPMARFRRMRRRHPARRSRPARLLQTTKKEGGGKKPPRRPESPEKVEQRAPDPGWTPDGNGKPSGRHTADRTVFCLFPAFSRVPLPVSTAVDGPGEPHRPVQPAASFIAARRFRSGAGQPAGFLRARTSARNVQPVNACRYGLSTWT